VPGVAAAPVTTAAPIPTFAPVSLRPSIKITARAEPQTVQSVFESRGPGPVVSTGEPGREEGGWSWTDLLSSIDSDAAGDGRSEEDALADRMIGEIEALGLDAGVLLPRARIDEIAAAIQAGQQAGAREIVRRLAPAAVQRLSRRVLLNSELRSQTERYLRRYSEILSDAVGKDGEGYMVTALLSSDPGRAYLLLDAGIGELN
jgi:hypothetical protein